MTKKYFLPVFLIAYTTICGLLIYDYLVLHKATPAILVLHSPILYYLSATRQEQPDTTWVFRYICLGCFLTLAAKTYGIQLTPLHYLISLVFLILALLPKSTIQSLLSRKKS